MTEIFTAKTIEEAKELAAKKFGKKISEITFKIIEEPKKGFLGIGKTDAKVEASCADTTVIPEKKSETVIQEAQEEKTAAPAEEEKIKTEIAEKSENENNQEKNDDDQGDEYSLENFTLITDDSLVNPKVKIAMDYIDSVLRAMDVKAEFNVYQNETGAIITVDSDNNGTIIGRRGETLDAIQYLCSIIANKGDKDYFRITIDCFGYRKKRKETLEQLASKVAKSVLRTGRSQPLEPMNPYERRVIHSAVSKIEGVTSKSVGEEPYRKIIISSNNPRKGGGRRHNDNHRGSDRRNSRPRRHDNYEPRDIDLSTSFEKDYKKPKPEDNIEGGLYGKIKF